MFLCRMRDISSDRGFYRNFSKTTFSSVSSETKHTMTKKVNKENGHREAVSAAPVPTDKTQAPAHRAKRDQKGNAAMRDAKKKAPAKGTQKVQPKASHAAHKAQPKASKPAKAPHPAKKAAPAAMGKRRTPLIAGMHTPVTERVENEHPAKGARDIRAGKVKNGKLRVFSLGGLQEIGKNMTVIEYGEDIVVIDCGMAFPDEDMPGIDHVIPDITYLIKNAARVRGILITHGHEDHVGAAAYVLDQLPVPIYGTKLSLGIIQGKLEENPPKTAAQLCVVEAGDVITLGCMKAEFIHVNHSIADACAISVRTPQGVVFHTGDFKLDVSPMDGQLMDLPRIGAIGRAGVELLLCESTNAERAGFTPSERTVGSSLERIFMQYEDRRIIVATFSSNVHRVQQIINISHKHGRKVAVLGRSMVNIIGAAAELGYMDFPEDVLIDVEEMKRYKPEQLTLITTGSQGEPMSALYRIAFSEHAKVKLTAGDVVVLSSSAIPGNEKTVGNIVNALVKNGVKVVNDSVEEVHVSGHACREELKLMMALLKPKYLMPIHGENRHLYANREIGEFMGIPSDHIFIGEIGRVLEIDKNGARWAGTVPSGQVLVDGSSVGDIGSVVLRDRKHLSEDGLVVVVATVNRPDRMILSGPDIVSRGFVYVKESEELMNNTRHVAYVALERALARGVSDFAELKGEMRDALAKYIYQQTKRKPMILPIIMDL